MTDYTKVRYAVIMAVIGVAVSLWPGLTDFVSATIQSVSVIIGALWSFLRIAEEFSADDSAPMVHTQGRAAKPGFWQTVRRAL